MTWLKKLSAAALAAILVFTGICVSAPKSYAEAVTETEKNGQFFAGYYVDEACTIPSELEGGTQKWVDEGVLSMKMQLRKNPSDSSKYDIRLLSTVDTLDYKKVGFEISFDKNGNGAFESGEVTTWKSNSVAKRITANNSSFPFVYSPKVMDTDSEYFITGILSGITASNLDKAFLIRPFWTTQDGTTVYGESRWFTVNDMLAGSTNVNLTVKMTQSEFDAADSVSGITATVASKQYDGKYGHFNLTVADSTALPSASAVTIGGQTVIYRNLQNTAATDTTWYTVPAAAGATEFTIATKADLYGLNSVIGTLNGASGKTIYLVSDIELNDTSKVADWAALTLSEAADYGFTNWGGSAAVQFNSTLDGQGHTVSGLFYNAGDSANTGFIRFTGPTAVIRDLIMDKGFVRSGFRVGSIVGNAQGGLIEGVYSNVTVVSLTNNHFNNNGVGGIVGYTTGTTAINNCQYDGTVIGAIQFPAAGGIVGQLGANAVSKITNCSFTGTVDVSGAPEAVGNLLTGGIVGRFAQGGSLTVAYNVVDGQIKIPAGTHGAYSALVGDNSSGTAAYHNLATTNAFGNLEPNRLYGATGWAGSVQDGKYWVAVDDGVLELKSFRALSDKTETDVSGVTRTQADTKWYDNNSSADTFVINTAAELMGFAQLSASNNFAGKTIKLGADIVLNEGDASQWGTDAPATYRLNPISLNYDNRFTGTFDGQGHTISGLYMKRTDSYSGLFGAVGAGSVLKNFRLVNSYIEGSTIVGGVVGRTQGTVENVYCDATVVSGGGYAGGIVGQAWDTSITIRNCQYAGALTCDAETFTFTGGILGEIRATTANVENCLFTGSVTISKAPVGNKMAGGIVGAASFNNDTAIAKITGCVATGAIVNNGLAGDAGIGSILGWSKNDSSTATNCYGTAECAVNSTFIAGAASTANVIAAADMTGTLPAGLDGTYWVAVKGGTPQLKSFQTIVAVD